MSICPNSASPSGINALNSVNSAWTDSIPELVLFGQVKRETSLRRYDLQALRQLGDQEADIIAIARGIAKYAVTVNEPKEICYHLEKTWHLAPSGQPGPCWLDIPFDVHSSQVKPVTLKGYITPVESSGYREELCRSVADTLEKQKASRI